MPARRPARPPGPRPGPRSGAPAGRQAGQATVEFVALLPLLAVVAALLWQAVVAGQALWLAGTAAREAARAHAVQGDPAAAARGVLPATLRRGLRVRASDDGVAIRLVVPSVVGHVRIGTVRARARLEPQA